MTTKKTAFTQLKNSMYRICGTWNNEYRICRYNSRNLLSQGEKGLPGLFGKQLNENNLDRGVK